MATAKCKSVTNVHGGNSTAMFNKAQGSSLTR